MLSSREDLHSDMDLMVDSTSWSVLHAALPHSEQQDIDLEEYVVVEISIFNFFEDPFLVCLALKGINRAILMQVKLHFMVKKKNSLQTFPFPDHPKGTCTFIQVCNELKTTKLFLNNKNFQALSIGINS